MLRGREALLAAQNKRVCQGGKIPCFNGKHGKRGMIPLSPCVMCDSMGQNWGGTQWYPSRDLAVGKGDEAQGSTRCTISSLHLWLSLHLDPSPIHLISQSHKPGTNSPMVCSSLHILKRLTHPRLSEKDSILWIKETEVHIKWVKVVEQTLKAEQTQSLLDIDL